MATLHRWIEVGWNQRDTSIIAEVFDERIVSEGAVRSQGELIIGHDAVLDFHGRMVSAIPDIHIEILNLTPAGEIIIGEYRITGTHLEPYQSGAPAPGDKVVMHVTEVARFKEGRIVHRRDVISDARGVKARFGVE